MIDYRNAVARIYWQRKRTSFSVEMHRSEVMTAPVRTQLYPAHWFINKQLASPSRMMSSTSIAGITHIFLDIYIENPQPSYRIVKYGNQIDGAHLFTI